MMIVLTFFALLCHVFALQTTVTMVKGSTSVCDGSGGTTQFTTQQNQVCTANFVGTNMTVGRNFPIELGPYYWTYFDIDVNNFTFRGSIITVRFFNGPTCTQMLSNFEWAHGACVSSPGTGLARFVLTWNGTLPATTQPLTTRVTGTTFHATTRPS
jgi:hypothetical protein